MDFFFSSTPPSIRIVQPPSGETQFNVPYPHSQFKIYLPQFLLYIPRPWLVQPGPLDLHFVYACGGPPLPVYR